MSLWGRRLHVSLSSRAPAIAPCCEMRTRISYDGNTRGGHSAGYCLSLQILRRNDDPVHEPSQPVEHDWSNALVEVRKKNQRNAGALRRYGDSPVLELEGADHPIGAQRTGE